MRRLAWHRKALIVEVVTKREFVPIMLNGINSIIV